jgi:transposase-like protein
VLRYVPEFEKRWARHARPVNPSWRIDETSVSVRGRWHYLYRAVDKHGKSVEELAHRIRKRQSSCGLGRQRRAWSLKRGARLASQR